jgi:large subunit ribosomal protein L24
MRLLVHRKAKRVRTRAVVRHRLHVTKGDTVQVVSGEFKGKRGRVIRVYPKTGRVTVDGINMVKRHKRQTQTDAGGIISFAAPIHHSKVMLIDPKTNVPTRVRRRVDQDGTVERIAKSGEPIPRTR